MTRAPRKPAPRPPSEGSTPKAEKPRATEGSTPKAEKPRATEGSTPKAEKPRSAAKPTTQTARQSTARERSRCMYVAFLRGVSPMNLSMTALTACLKDAGYGDVKTLLSSGNVVFSAPEETPSSLEDELERAMLARLGRTFQTYVRTAKHLAELVSTDPFEKHRLTPQDKRVVTFLREAPRKSPRLPLGNRRSSHSCRSRHGGAQRLHTEPARSRVHDPAREDLRQGNHDSNLGYGRKSVRGSVERPLTSPVAPMHRRAVPCCDRLAWVRAIVVTARIGAPGANRSHSVSPQRTSHAPAVFTSIPWAFGAPVLSAQTGGSIRRFAPKLAP
ncbi:MAG: DUF1697 domain-containing protein [Polyangiaceae bacterium]